MKQRRYGFTLVELFIVIGIIAALAAILFPVFLSVRAKGRQTVCVSNLRQLGVAVFQYAGDYDDHYPYGGDPGDLTTNAGDKSKYAAQLDSMKAHNSYLYNVMSAFVKDRELWHCPADTGFGEVDPTNPNIPLAARSSCFQAYGMSYAYTTLLALQGQTLTNVRAWSDRPSHNEHDYSDIPLLFDLSGQWHGGTNTEDERFNMVMLDGHAITVNQEREMYLNQVVFDLPLPPAEH